MTTGNVMGVYTIGPHSNRILFERNNGIFPSTEPNHVVYNVGKVEVYAETIYGTSFGWIGVVNSATVRPGETKVIDNFGKAYLDIALKVYNSHDDRAVVNPGNYTKFAGDNPYVDVKFNELMRDLVAAGTTNIPQVGVAFSVLVKAFWPDEKPTVWEVIRDKVKALVDEEVQQAINGILEGDVRYYKERIDVLISQLDNKKARGSYMNIAEDLVGFEKKFSFDSSQPDYKRVNYALLPLFSAMTTLKVHFYAGGIVSAKNIGLTEEDVDDVKTYMTRLLKGETGAIAYIHDMLKERVMDAYNNYNMADLYNGMMNVRSFIAVYGLEHIPRWSALLEDPSSTAKVYVDVVSYSQHYGAQSPDLYREAFKDEMAQPLTPELIDGGRNALASVRLHMWRDRLGGAQVRFRNGDEYMMGTASSDTRTVDFKGARLDKLTVVGGGALDQFTFHLSDGRVETVGRAYGTTVTEFQLQDHHIASIFVSTGSYRFGGQAANVAVSFLRNN